MINVPVVYAETEAIPEELASLYAMSAVLIDGDSGRVLFEKQGKDIRPMASTTKIMTCIIALEQGNPDDIAAASAYASSRPKVKLGVQEGETYYLRDLLYSLMLESHNDAAVVIAEHIGGSVEGFAQLMNEKAKELNCHDTYFITPNGLDATETLENGEEKMHSTTAADLARIMKYCINESPQKDEFLNITQTTNYNFSNTEGTRTFQCSNHNAFLSMMDGAISGKTGFTNNAGYCYVGALQRDGRTFIVALLGCGWPNNKSYKWSDTKKLMNYGLEHYTYRDVFEKNKTFDPVVVNDGIPQSWNSDDDAYETLKVDLSEEEQTLSVLLREDEEIDVRYDIPDQLKAPVKKGEKVGTVQYYLGEDLLGEYPIVTANTVNRIDFKWCFEKITATFLV